MKAITTRINRTSSGALVVRASDGDSNTIALPFDHAKDADVNHKLAAVALCQRMAWDGALASGWQRKDTYVHCFTTSVIYTN